MRERSHRSKFSMISVETLDKEYFISRFYVNLYVNSDLGFLRELSMQKGGFLDLNINKYIYI